ncbi:MAG: hypothetical protein RL095_1283 [Verrucomicrobiota bacterium]|jgi:tRNA nucleotidyltransferase/poly(A) polymerase
MHPSLEKVPDFSQALGIPVYVVGGAVRDALLDRPIADIDIASALHPQEFKLRCRRLGWHTIDTGIEHGTVTVLVEGIAYEHTTFRLDVSCDGRNATIRFSDTIEEDLSRRDFTINAMAWRPGEFVDPFGGRGDLIDHRILRCVGDPSQRFAEDKLRIVRAARFAARFSLLVSPDLAPAARLLAPNYAVHVSPERSAAETFKARLHGPEYLRHCRDFGVLEHLVPAAAGIDDDAFEEWITLLSRACVHSEEAWFAALASARPDQGPQVAAESLAEHLRLSTRLKRAAMQMLQLSPHLNAASEGAATLRRLIEAAGPNWPHVRDYALEVLPSRAALRQRLFEHEGAALAALATPIVNGATLSRLGLKPSPLFKELIAWAGDRQAEGMKQEELLRLLQEKLRRPEA